MFESFPIKSASLVITAESVRKVSGSFTLCIRGEDSTSIDGNTCVNLLEPMLTTGCSYPSFLTVYAITVPNDQKGVDPPLRMWYSEIRSVTTLL